MTQGQVTVEDIRRCLGAKGKACVIEVEKGMIKKLAEAVEDPNPLWQDEEIAKKSIYGSIVAPPSLHATVMMSGAPTRPDVPLMPRILDGGGEWEYYLPIRPGDVITCVTKLAEVTERETKSGKMVFLRFETTHTNEKNELVGKSISTLITY